MARRATPHQPQPADLTPEKMRVAIPRLEKRIRELDDLDTAKIVHRFDPRIGALERSIDETLVTIFGIGTVDYERYEDAKRLDRGAQFIGRELPVHEIRAGLERGRQDAISILSGIIKRFQEELEQSDSNVPESESTIRAPQTYDRIAFIVHGHDEAARESVARFVAQIDFKPIILHERPNKGRTIITKLREEGAHIGFAIVLMTPDDYGAEVGDSIHKLRARQNVVFELGFFVGVCGPERVAALVKGSIERPSDLDGVVYIEFDEAGAWKQKLGRELQAAGHAIDWNRVMR